MKLKKFAPQKNAAQAIVEFAIVLPILLLLLYGLLEAGRLLFMYSSVVTASRQAARYGSATGQGGNWLSEGGPDNSGVARYQDCYGIRRAAQRADYLNAFSDADIIITYDDGPGTEGPDPWTTAPTVPPWRDVCNGNTDNAVNPASNNTTRIDVAVRGHFNSIVPSISNLIPFFKRDIQATSARTILVAVSIQVAGGGGPAAPTVSLTDSSIPMGGTAPGVTQPGQAFTITATVNGAAGPGAGTVTFSFNGVAVCSNVQLVNGTANCPMSAPFTGTPVPVTVDYTPADATVYNSATGSIMHLVGPADTVTTVVDTPHQTYVDEQFIVSVLVTSAGSTPTGTVSVSLDGGANCTITLVNGQGSCPNPFSYHAVGNYHISATYAPGDFEHNSSTGSATHEVVTVKQPPTNTPAPPTVIPTTPPPPSVTPVAGCSYIRDNTGSITFSLKTMTLVIKNTANNYPVTVSSIWVAWNYDNGHIGGQTSLYLQKAQAISVLGNNTFWTGNLNQPSALLPLSTPVIVPANNNLTLTFTFDKFYDGPRDRAQVQVQFSTPGCENYAVVRPAGLPTITPFTNANLMLQMKSAGTDTNTDSQFRFRVLNTGTGPGTNVSVRIYFTLENSKKVDDYELTVLSSSGGPATVSGPTQVANKDYYYTITYGASIVQGGSWEFYGSLHLKSYVAGEDATNDYWHGAGGLPSDWSDWTAIPVYIDGNRVWGAEPP